MNLSEQIECWLTELKSTFNAAAVAAPNQPQAPRPLVTLCYAQSLDGSIALSRGGSLALSSAASTQLTHQLRSLHDGILVGIGTVLSDDPLLNVRCWSGPDPQPMVLDSQARFPAAARLSNLDAKRCWVLTTATPHTVEDTDADTDSGPEYLSLPADANGRVALDAALQMLWQRGIRSLMVEGGGSVITAFLQARLADAVILTIAPTMVGGYRAVSDLGFTCKQQLPQIAPLHTARLGEDLIMWGQLQFGDVTP